MAFGRKPLSTTAKLPPGQRVYAIGDVHGEIGLFHQLLGQIRADAETRGPAVTTLISLGDIIDRGEGAAGLALSLTQLNDKRFIVLKGNHEAWLVACYRGDEDAMGFWMRYGGRATMKGFGVSDADIDTATSTELLALLRAHVPIDLI
jgi:serine/threonine protein phosphatase 1